MTAKTCKGKSNGKGNRNRNRNRNRKYDCNDSCKGRSRSSAFGEG
jgi:hypothetical protein